MTIHVSCNDGRCFSWFVFDSSLSIMMETESPTVYCLANLLETSSCVRSFHQRPQTELSPPETDSHMIALTILKLVRVC